MKDIFTILKLYFTYIESCFCKELHLQEIAFRESCAGLTTNNQQFQI